MILNDAVFLLDLRCEMVAPIPKTKADELFFEISDIEQKITTLTSFQATKLLRRADELLKTGVDVGTVWIVKGYIYSISGQPNLMLSAFKNAESLGMQDPDDYFNYATQYYLNGYFVEAAKGFSKSFDDVAQKALYRIAFSTFDFDLVEDLMTLPTWKEKLRENKELLTASEINLQKTKEILEILNSCFKSRNVRFQLKGNEISEDGEINLHYDVMANENLITEILREFDNITSSSEYFDDASKLNILPIQDIRFFNTQKLPN